jgi:predicted RNase H-like HicB family nuclease
MTLEEARRACEEAWQQYEEARRLHGEARQQHLEARHRPYGKFEFLERYIEADRRVTVARKAYREAKGRYAEEKAKVVEA